MPFCRDELVESLKVSGRLRVVGSAVGCLELLEQHVRFVPLPVSAAVDDDSGGVLEHTQVAWRLAHEYCGLDSRRFVAFSSCHASSRRSFSYS